MLNNFEPVESKDEFFNKSPQQVELSLGGVVIMYDFLIHKRHVGRWKIHHCIVCNMDTHGVPETSAVPCLISTQLMTDLPSITALRHSDRFSAAFKIALPPLGNVGPSSPRIFPEKGLQMDTKVAAIQQLMSTYLKKEEDQMSERIQRFTEQQQAALSELETRVRQDRNTLFMLLAQNETPVEKKLQSLSLTKEDSPLPTPTKKGSFSFQSPSRGQISARRRTVDIPDDDILFEFDSEYLDHNASTSDPFDASEFEYEDSSRDEGISIPRPNQPLRYNHDSALAKSLPMRVPALSNYQTQEIEIEDRVWSHHY